MRKELTCYISTNEEGEEIKVQRVADDPQFFLLTLGSNRMVVNVAELMESIGLIEHYATLFDHQDKMKTQSKAPVPRVSKTSDEEEGTIVFGNIMGGVSQSELALERMTQHMKGDTIVVVEKKDGED